VGSGTYRETLEALVHAIATGNRRLFEALVARGWELDRSDRSGPWEDVQRYAAEGARRDLLLGAGAGFRDHVHFLGRLDHSRLKHLFPCADVAVFPSLVPEAYPLVLIESLANGIPPAVTDFSGFRDGLETLEPLLGPERVDRFRLPFDAEGRVEGIVDALAGLLDDPDREALKPELRTIAVEHFDWRVRARQMADAYRALVG
jgi:glycosyltransferase involved in cell wall biosynthesis